MREGGGKTGRVGGRVGGGRQANVMRVAVRPGGTEGWVGGGAGKERGREGGSDARRDRGMGGGRVREGAGEGGRGSGTPHKTFCGFVNGQHPNIHPVYKQCVTTMLHGLTLRPPPSLYFYKNHKRGGTVPPR